MFSKSLFVFLVVYFLSNISCGQRDNTFFRKEYTYIETSKGFYKIHTTPHTWADAKRVCALEGASLFYPEDNDEASAVISFWNRTLPTYPRVFVGMSELMVPGVFETIDGKLLSEVFNKWVPGEPNHSGGVEHCVNMYKEPGAINDCPCDKLEPFICKKSLQSLEWNYQCNMYNLGTPINLHAGAWWDDYQPEGADHEECGAMFYTGRLINISCDTRSFFICEHEVDNSSLPQEQN